MNLYDENVVFSPSSFRILNSVTLPRFKSKLLANFHEFASHAFRGDVCEESEKKVCRRGQASVLFSQSPYAMLIHTRLPDGPKQAFVSLDYRCKQIMFFAFVQIFKVIHSLARRRNLGREATARQRDLRREALRRGFTLRVLWEHS